MTWCWLIGHRFEVLGENVYGRTVFVCSRCLKKKT